ncbi:MAG TPA: hypothetical protein VJ859_13360 [Allosphingosinicella sp.]|nr:hypothetical protein [Allosphingosinicella sp.]
MKQGRTALACGTALVALSLLLAPAYATSTQAKAKRKPVLSAMTIGGFTPAVSDPRLAAAFAGRLGGTGFRFTPSPADNHSKAVKVAVRARTTASGEARRFTAATVADATTITALTPTIYNLGLAVGWKRFALSGDVAKIEGGLIPEGREGAEVGVSYLGKKFTGRVQLGAERIDGQLRGVPQESSYSLDVGGSYSIARNLALTGGVRYKIQHDRLQALTDERRDSQAVYIGTAFRF